MIYQIYRIEVAIPEAVWQAFGHLPIYETKVAHATADAPTSGTDRASSVMEWAETSSLPQAKVVENNLKEMITFFQAKLNGT